MWEEYMRHIDKSISCEIKNFVKNEVFGDSEYLFVSKVNNKNIGYCSKCKREYHVGTMKHNERGICPICGSSLTVKLVRYVKKNCVNEACFYYFEKSIVGSNVVVCKGYYVLKDYAADYKNPKEEYSLMALYIFEDKNSIMLRNAYGYSWGIRSSIFDFNQGWLANKMCYCSFQSIENAIQNTSFQYIPYKMFQGNYSMVKPFAEYSKHPWIEQLIKVGFADIVRDKLEGKHLYNCLNYEGKDIYKILKLTRKDFKEIRKYKKCIRPLFLTLYQLQLKDNSKLTPYEVEDIEFAYEHNYDRLKDILKYTTMRKAFKYMNKQYAKYRKKFYSKGDVSIIWSDYIEDCIKLNMDLNLEYVLYPKDLKAAHENTITKIKIKENKVYDKKIKKRVEMLSEYIFEFEGLMIRPALSSKELIEESSALNHCVASNYTKKYADGETNILLIRKISEVDKPYFTLELKKEAIVQVHGKRNCNPSKDVEAFIKAFKNSKLDNKKSKERISA